MVSSLCRMVEVWSGLWGRGRKACLRGPLVMTWALQVPADEACHGSTENPLVPPPRIHNSPNVPDVGSQVFLRAASPGSRYPVGDTGGATAIDLVTDDRMPDRLKMRTNLVSPTRTRHQHQACSPPSERFLDLIARAGGLWTQCMNRHTCQASRLRADRPVDEACG